MHWLRGIEKTIKERFNEQLQKTQTRNGSKFNYQSKDNFRRYKKSIENDQPSKAKYLAETFPILAKPRYLFSESNWFPTIVQREFHRKAKIK